MPLYRYASVPDSVYNGNVPRNTYASFIRNEAKRVLTPAVKASIKTSLIIAPAFAFISFCYCKITKLKMIREMGATSVQTTFTNRQAASRLIQVQSREEEVTRNQEQLQLDQNQLQLDQQAYEHQNMELERKRVGLELRLREIEAEKLRYEENQGREREAREELERETIALRTERSQLEKDKIALRNQRAQLNRDTDTLLHDRRRFEIIQRQFQPQVPPRGAVASRGGGFSGRGRIEREAL
jgi:hypothetical protein